MTCTQGEFAQGYWSRPWRVTYANGRFGLYPTTPVQSAVEIGPFQWEGQPQAVHNAGLSYYEAPANGGHRAGIAVDGSGVLGVLVNGPTWKVFCGTWATPPVAPPKQVAMNCYTPSAQANATVSYNPSTFPLSGVNGQPLEISRVLELRYAEPGNMSEVAVYAGNITYRMRDGVLVQFNTLDGQSGCWDPSRMGNPRG